MNSNITKWLIHHSNTLSSHERQRYWEQEHSSNNYKTVWSMTDDEAVRNKVISELARLKCVDRILIPGCGSRVNLQNDIARKFPKSMILCTDFDGVIEVAKLQKNARNIEYRACDSANLGFVHEWDAVIIVNSILSDSDIENRAIIQSCYNALDKGGVLLGFFPTIFAAVDISILEENKKRMSFINLEESSFYEEKQKISQIFYTPLRLRMILNKTGFIKSTMEIFFCDSEYFINHSEEYYGISDPDIHIYEHFVVAHTQTSHVNKKITNYISD